MTHADPFEGLATYYDRMMEHVNYDRWLMATALLADLVPKDSFRHVDVACGTSVLIKGLRRHGWNSVGVDLSPAMLKAGCKVAPKPSAVVADMCALPFDGHFDYATCLFDSLNFLLDPALLPLAFESIYSSLAPGGVLYFDVITERMVTEHFEGQRWEENNNGFVTTWEGTYDRATRVAETTVRVGTGPLFSFRERAHEAEEVDSALKWAGFTLLGRVDAESWKAPGRKSVRVDYVAVKGEAKPYKKAFAEATKQVRALLA